MPNNEINSYEFMSTKINTLDDRSLMTNFQKQNFVIFRPTNNARTSTYRGGLRDGTSNGTGWLILTLSMRDVQPFMAVLTLSLAKTSSNF